MSTSHDMRIGERLCHMGPTDQSAVQLTKLLLDHHPRDRAEAIDHLGFAIAEGPAMKMQPLLQWALRRRALVGA